jgi:hypothetical protein
MMKKRLFLLGFSTLLFACNPPVDPPTSPASEQGSHPIELSNGQLDVTIDAYGGAFTRIVHQEQPVNPLTWAVTAAQMPENNQAGAPFQGHFLCLGRWGQPSKGEMAAGVPHNGEPANSMWIIREQTENSIEMAADAPLDGMEVNRTVALQPNAPVFKVTERFTNTFSLSRPTNVVQHITLGPPFLSPALRVNTNATHGFNQKFATPDPHRLSYEWPMGIADTTGRQIDLRRTDEEENYVTTHLFPDTATYGWVTALQPKDGLLLGYVWKLDEYPWINIWNYYAEGQPAAKGLEFGTTGIGAPYEALITQDTRFREQTSFEYIDAGETLNKSFAGFLIPVPNVQKVTGLDITSTSIVVHFEASRGSTETFILPNPL